MRITRIVALSLLFGTLFLIPAAAAAAPHQQWFPTENSVIEYAVSNIMVADNGTIYETDTFDIYNGLGNTIFLVPVDLKETPYTSWEMNETNQKVTLRHTYRACNSTHLYKTITVHFSDQAFSGDNYYLVYKYSEYDYQARIGTVHVNYPVPRANFETGMPFGGFIDYIDNTIEPGSSPIAGFIINTITDEHFILTNMGTDTNLTLVAWRDGKISSYSITSSFNLLGSGYKVTQWVFSVSTAPLIPGIPVALLVGIAGLTSVILIAFSKKRLDKR